MKLSNKLFGVMQGKIDNLNNTVQENLVAIRVVKAFVRADFEKKKFRKANDENMEMSVRCERIMNLQMPLILLISTCSSSTSPIRVIEARVIMVLTSTCAIIIIDIRIWVT